jgi:hypothetical protein
MSSTAPLLEIFANDGRAAFFYDGRIPNLVTSDFRVSRKQMLKNFGGRQKWVYSVEKPEKNGGMFFCKKVKHSEHRIALGM